MFTPIGKDHWLTRRLEKQPDIVHVGIELVLRPVSHFVRSLVIFDGVREGSFHGVWAIKHLHYFRLELAMGNFATARDLLSQYRDDWLHSTVDYFDEDEAERTRLLCTLLDDGDFAGIARLFRTWEATLVGRMELFEDGYDQWLRSRAGGQP